MGNAVRRLFHAHVRKIKLAEGGARLYEIERNVNHGIPGQAERYDCVGVLMQDNGDGD